MSLSKSDNKSTLKEIKENELKRLELMNKVSRILISNFPLEELFVRIMDTVLEITEADRSFLMLLDESGNIYPRTFRGKSEYSKELDELRDKIVHYTMRKGGPFYIRNAQEDLLKYKELCEGIDVENLPIKTIICQPLRNAPRTSQSSDLDLQHERRKSKDAGQTQISPLDITNLLGVIYVDSQKMIKHFSMEDMEIMEVLISYIAISIEKNHFYELATIDGLTKLYIRRFFTQRLREEFRKSNKYNLPLSLIMMDIDHFKSFNDTYGHQFGDIVLAEVAKIVKDTSRGKDIAGRYGGEEFALVLPETDESGAKSLAERIREKVESHLISRNGTEVRLTISLGIATCPDKNIESYEELISKADQALYLAKETGRNRVCIYSDDMPPILKSKKKDDKLLEMIGEGGAEVFRSLELFFKVVKNITSIIDRKELFEVVADAIIEMTEPDRVLIFIREDKKNNNDSIEENNFELKLKLGRKQKNEEILEAGNISYSTLYRVVRTGISTYIPQVKMELDPITKTQTDEVKSVACIPLMNKDEKEDEQAMGAIYIDAKPSNQLLSKKTLDILDALVSYASNSLQRITLYEKVQESNRQIQETNRKLKQRLWSLAMLFDTSKELNALLDTERIVNLLLLSAMGGSGARSGSVLILDESTNEFSVKDTSGLDEELIGQIRFSKDSYFIKRLSAGDPVRIKDLDEKELSDDIEKIKRLNCVISIPIIKDNKLKGALNLGAKIDGREFDTDNINILSTLVNQASISLENASLYEKVSQSSKEMKKKIWSLTTLFDTSKEFNSYTDIDRILNLLLYTAVGNSGAESGSILFIDNDVSPQKLILKLSAGLDIDTIRDIEFSLDGEFANILKKDEPIFIKNLLDENILSKDLDNVKRLHCVLSLPIIKNKILRGALNLGARTAGKDFDKESINLLSALVNQASVAIENAILFKIAFKNY